MLFEVWGSISKSWFFCLMVLAPASAPIHSLPSCSPRFDSGIIVTSWRRLYKLHPYLFPSTGCMSGCTSLGWVLVQAACACILSPSALGTQQNERLRKKKIWLTPVVLSSYMSRYLFNLFSPVVSFIRSLRVFLLIWQDDYNESSLVATTPGYLPTCSQPLLYSLWLM